MARGGPVLPALRFWYPLRRVDTEEHVEDGFVPGADFADVVALYEADRKLRTLIHDGMERIEVRSTVAV